MEDSTKLLIGVGVVGGIAAYLYYKKKTSIVPVPVVAATPLAPPSADQLKLDIANLSSQILSKPTLMQRLGLGAVTRSVLNDFTTTILKNLDSFRCRYVLLAQ
jgi:hypothetical protein